MEQLTVIEPCGAGGRAPAWPGSARPRPSPRRSDGNPRVAALARRHARRTASASGSAGRGSPSSSSARRYGAPLAALGRGRAGHRAPACRRVLAGSRGRAPRRRPPRDPGADPAARTRAWPAGRTFELRTRSLRSVDVGLRDDRSGCSSFRRDLEHDHRCRLRRSATRTARSKRSGCSPRSQPRRIGWHRAGSSGQRPPTGCCLRAIRACSRRRFQAHRAPGSGR